VVSVDTNVVVRLLVADDRGQASRAKALFGAEEIFVATTVLLEVAWVLRSVYGFDESAVAESLENLAGLPNVRVENPDRLALALQWRVGGLDIADALHIAASHGDFVTFDEKLVRRARRAGVRLVRAV
jgi:predicted nucleic-acid-binding protein